MWTAIGDPAGTLEVGGDALRALQNKGASLVLGTSVSTDLGQKLYGPFARMWAVHRPDEVMPEGLA